ncbi:MAG: RHS repeat protein [Clostridiales bacterium]|mgnify:CR=1 FL=1|nr:RHS repeat protein [Clostridiales bacterium]
MCDHTGREVRYLYEKGRLSGTEGPEGERLCYRYGQNNRMERVETADGEVLLENRYDRERRVSLQKFPEGESLSFAYDGRGGTRTLDGEGREERIRVDRDGRLLVRERGGRKEERAYDGEGRLVRCRDGCGGEETFAYDGEGRLVCHTLPDGEAVRFGYGMAGQLVYSRDTAGRRRADLYDRDGARTARFGPCGESLLFMREEDGSGMRIIHPDGSVTEYVRDGCGRILKILRGGKTEVSVERDRGGRPVCIRGNGKEVRFSWDASDRILEAEDQDGNRLEQDYDRCGHLVRRLERRADGKERTLHYRWEKGGLLKETEGTDGTWYRYAYDACGRMTERQDRQGNVWTYVYDRAGRLRQETDPCGRSRQYERDPEGRCIRRIDTLGRVTAYRYDGAGRLCAVTDPSGETAEYRYDPEGRPHRTDRTEEEGERERIPGRFPEELRLSMEEEERLTDADWAEGIRRRVRYGKCGELEELCYSDREGVLDRLCYEWDGEGQLVSLCAERRGMPQESGRYAYRYDLLGRLTGVEKDGKPLREYRYDRNGNRTCLIHYGPDGKESSREEAPREGRTAEYRGLAERADTGYDGRERGTWSGQEDGACLFLRDHLGSPLRRISADGSVPDRGGRGAAGFCRAGI